MRSLNYLYGILSLVILSTVLVSYVYLPKDVGTERDIRFNTIQTGEDARCLDGSYPGYYYSKGQSQNTLIYLIGMGNCAAPTEEAILETCYQRSFTEIGSNVGRPDILPQSMATGVFSSDNPIFGDWNLVIIPACEGGVYIGDKTVTYKDRQLYFRGQGLMKAIIGDLIETRGLDISEQVVLSGGSAGALGTYQYSNYLQKVIPNSHVRAIPDSGYFLDQPESFHQTLQTFGAFMKNDDYAEIFPECAYQYGNDKEFYKCILPEYSWKYINVDTFIVGSLYDVWQFGQVYGFKCRTNFNNCDQPILDFMNDLRQQEYDQVSHILEYKPTWGSWLVSCPFHGIIQDDWVYSPEMTIPSGSEYTIEFTLQDWFSGKTGPQVQRLDKANWPNNTGCANIFNN